MATSFQAHAHHSFESATNSLTNRRNGSSSSSTLENNSAIDIPSTATAPHPTSTSSETNTALTDLVRSFEHRNKGMAPSMAIGASQERLLEWIRSERMRKLPPEGSSYDKVLACARLFVERLHSFDAAVQHFAGDSQMATKLAYIYCASLLQLGEENSDALLNLFNFFYRCSTDLKNLLGRAELFAVSRAIKDQVVLALADLVTLVVEITVHFQKHLDGITSGTVAIDIHGVFAGPIESFRTRCEEVSELMWNHQLIQQGNVGKVTDVRTLRQWLEPEDPVLAQVTKYTAQFAQERTGSTCLWVAPYLTRFLKGNQRVLAITGKQGCGKSILATVINDHLQHPVGGVSYEPIFIPINSQIPALVTPLAVAKSILSQLFALRVGNLSLYQTLSDTYERCRKTVTEEQYVDLLWDALKSVLPATLEGAKETVLIVGGVDETTCGQTPLLARLKHATADVGNLNLIVLGSEKQEIMPKQTTVQITPELIFDDIAAVVRQVFQDFQAYNGLAAEEREICVNRIVKTADGSFLWAKLASKRVRDENPSGGQGLVKAAGSLIKAGYAIGDLVSHRLKSNVHHDAVRMIAWLATAARPLTTGELSALLSVHLEKATIIKQEVDPVSLLKPLASLVFYQSNIVYLSHSQVRTAITDTLSREKAHETIKDTRLDLTRRLALYIKHTVVGKDEPSVDSLDQQFTSSLLERHPLLDFAIRYWLDHTRISFSFNTDQEVTTAGKALSQVLPTSSLVPRLEMTVWKRKPTPVLMLVHDTQTRLYQQVFGTKHPATLQAELCQALFYQTVEDAQPSLASRIFYNAAKKCQTVLSVQHVITMQMTQHFLDFTASQATTSRTEIMSRRVEMLEMLVECYRIHYGSTSEMVVSTLFQLAEHYRAIKEEQKAQEISVLLQRSSVNTNSEVVGSRRPSDQSLVIQLHGRKDTIEHGTVLILDEAVEDDTIITPSFNLESLLSRAEKYTRDGNVMAAERTYVDIWQQISKEDRPRHSAESDHRNIKALMAYAEFLKSQKRGTEVASILSSFWEEHGHAMSTSEEIVSQYTAVAKLMKSVGLSWLSLDVLRQCSQRISHQSSLYQEIQEYTRATCQEVVQTAATSTSTMSEVNLQEMAFSGSEVSATATMTLVNMYMAQHKWKDATKTLKRVLRVTWPSLFAPSTGDVVLPSKDVQYCIELAQRLRECYRYRRQSVKEEDVYRRLYHALRHGRPTGDKVLENLTRGLVQLYERTCQTDKLLSLHRDILNDYTKRFGEDHPIVLKELWTLADLARPRTACVDYYMRIVRHLNKQSDTCHPDAFEPLLIVATELVNQERYSEAIQPCWLLFNTLKNPNLSPKLRDQAFVRSVYERYAHCLRMTHAESHVIHDVAAEYRKRCLTIFGAKSTITIQATKTLANIAQTFKQYEAEAAELYKALLETRSGEVDIDYDDIQATLEGIYEEQPVSPESISSSHNMSQVISARSKRLSAIRSSYGWAHESSLSQMEELISLYANQGDTQTATSVLQEGTIEVLSSEDLSSKLIMAAKSIASGYRAIDQVQKAEKLAQDIYQQIVARDTTNIDSVKFDLTSSQRQSLLFLAQFEYSLRGEEKSLLTLNEIHSSLLAQYLYFERFRTEIRSPKSISLQGIIPTVSHLQGLLYARGYMSTASLLMEQFTNYFMATQGQQLQLKRSQATIFLSTLLEHFHTHSSQNFLRSIAVASHNRVLQLLSAGDHQSSSDLALAAFQYIRAHDGFSTLATMKLVFKMGLAISAWTIQSRAESQEMQNVSGTIVKEMLNQCKTKNIDLSQLDGVHLNNIIRTLDKQKDYHSLAWILTSLWTQRQQRTTSPTYSSEKDVQYTLALGRMLVITRYLVADYTSAIRLAEDIVYNCARVHGALHPNTVEMTMLLSQMYSSVAQGYQTKANQRELAYQYYKKAAALHENALHVLVDPSSASPPDTDTPSEPSPASSPGGGSGGESTGKRVRQHLHLLKLSIERLGSWPKDYAEYERLNADLFNVFGDDLRGVEGLDRWNLKQFGAGKAEASDDLFSSNAYPRFDLSALAIPV
ncbi:hypothetical protein BDW59DRAFT_167290 [Aspergillus cavernicola]|uniref:Nephrocystin 3-like N-terminal domain-containing protein n=1 Tax=Aspergillus cavernicola TaxID=176166 RepID=A0ABR4HF24_9EURO